MAWFRCIGGSGGGTVTLERIVEAYSADTSQDNTIPRTQWDINDVDNNYVTFNTSTNKWEVTQAFEGTVVLAVRNWKASNSPPFQGLYVNGLNVMTVSANGSAVGAYGVGIYMRNFTVGTTFWTGKDGSAGWEAPYLLVVKGKLTDDIFTYNSAWAFN
jgi:hypothetical protein